MSLRAARHFALLAFACAALPCTRLAAQQPSATPATFQVPHATPDMGGVVPYFVLLLVLAGGGIYLVKNGLPMRGGPRNGSERKLQISEMRSLGNRQFLVVVEYEENKMLLGVTPGKIDYLCALENRAPADFAALVPDAAKPAVES
jgi:flagellar biogenesis protein FliO